MTDTALFWHWTRKLRRRFPSYYGVSIRLVDGSELPKGDHGDCRFHEKSQTFAVRISRNLPAEHTSLSLLHEWAHVQRWHLPEGFGDDPHDALFHLIEGLIVKAWTEES